MADKIEYLLQELDPNKPIEELQKDLILLLLKVGCT
jgi:hypothetical protein